mgnify:CR=1 FL=1
MRHHARVVVPVVALARARAAQVLLEEVGDVLEPRAVRLLALGHLRFVHDLHGVEHAVAVVVGQVEVGPALAGVPHPATGLARLPTRPAA